MSACGHVPQARAPAACASWHRGQMELGNKQLLLLEVGFALFAWSAIARVFWAPRLAALDTRQALRALIAPQMFRIVGITLLANGVTAPGLDVGFAQSVATGDAIVALLAVIAFIALGRPGNVGLIMAALVTVVGTFDLLLNLARGMRIGAAEYLGAGWFVVAFVVPLMLVTHIMAATRLVRDRL
jgi:hypothetical protein